MPDSLLKLLVLTKIPYLWYTFLTMQTVATITSKRQFTIPALMFRELGFGEGQRVIVRKIGRRLEIESAVSLVERLAGSLKVPAKFAGFSEDEIIETTKREHFAKKYKIK